MSAATPNLIKLATRGLAGELVDTDYDGWSGQTRAEFEQNRSNGQVGGRLLLETGTMRVWEIDLGPGESLPAHCHVLDYTWLALGPGQSRQLTSDGSTRLVSYERGDQRFFVFEEGEYLLHNLENVGQTRLRFLTTEFLDSKNQPFPLPADTAQGQGGVA
ncbi:hypothetical protein ACIQGO_16290 [Streptomyces shenzhenensis]|uniref:hypothetical protein n=1 Tax=Streptomyces shenzhenensis TaxID=943815 RepID=UPI00382D2E6C